MNTRLARFRRPLAAAFAAAAVGLAVLALRPPAPPSVPVLVAARDLPGGATLHSRDLRSIPLPAAVVPDGAVRSGAVRSDAVRSGAVRSGAVGRMLTGPMRRGEVLTDVRLAGGGLLGGQGSGTVATPIRITDAGAAGLLHSGDRVDVLAAVQSPDGTVPPGRARAVALGVPVLAVPPASAGAAGDQGALIVLATTREQARVLAGAGPLLSIAIVS